MHWFFVISAFMAFADGQQRAPPGVNPQQYQQPPPGQFQQQPPQQFQQQQQFQGQPQQFQGQPQQFQGQPQQFQGQPPPQQFQGQQPPQQFQQQQQPGGHAHGGHGGQPKKVLHKDIKAEKE